MAKFVVVWTLENDSAILNSVVTVDDRLIDAIVEDHEYEALMLPIMYEYSRDYDFEDAYGDYELAQGFMHSAKIISIFSLDTVEMVECADNTNKLVPVSYELPTPNPDLPVMH
jgi:hypothetical protein